VGTAAGIVALLRLVTGIVDGPERRGARRRSVRPSVQGWSGPSATVQTPSTYRPHHT